MPESTHLFEEPGTLEQVAQEATQSAKPRLRPLCAPGHTGRKRGKIVRTRTIVSQAHIYQWLGSFGNPGHGQYREKLRRAVTATGSYLSTHQLPQDRALLRLDG